MSLCEDRIAALCSRVVGCNLASARYNCAKTLYYGLGIPIGAHDSFVRAASAGACMHTQTAASVHTQPTPPLPTHAKKRLYGPHTNQKQPIHNASTICIGAMRRWRLLKKTILLARRGGCMEYRLFSTSSRHRTWCNSFCVQNGGAWVSNRPSCLHAGCSSKRKRTQAGLGAVIGLVHTIGVCGGMLPWCMAY